VSAKTGVPRNSIVPIKNYCTEFEPTVKPGILILRGVYEALSAATDYLREYSDLSGLSGEFKKLKVCHQLVDATKRLVCIVKQQDAKLLMSHLLHKTYM
jgi:hypothetical protein